MTENVASSKSGSFLVHVADEEFERFAKNAGNLVAANLLPEDEFIRPLFLSIGEQLATYRVLPSPDTRVPLHIGIINHPEPDAFAELCNGVFYLAIHSGQLLSSIEAASQMQDAIGAFAQDFGVRQDSPERLSLTTPLGVTSFLNYLHGAKDTEDLFGEQKDPNDPSTQRAMQFVSTCVQFALLHEFGHVANGHLGWLSERAPRARLREVSF